jgi:apolipoprotein N-acyltransferase
MHVYGGLASPLAGAAVLGLAAFLGLYHAAAGAVLALWGGRGWPERLGLFGAGWLLAELLRNSLFTGFPWGAAGYAHVDGPLAWLAPWVGVYGIGVVAALLAAAAVAVATAPAVPRLRRWGGAAAIAGLLAVGFLPWPESKAPSAGRFSVTLLQGNIPQDEKFEGGSGIPLALEWYYARLQDSRAQLVVTPETAIPVLPVQLPDEYLPAIRRLFQGGERAALVGMPLGNFEAGYTNSVLGFGATQPYRYDKHHLVPFGEFIPPLFKWFTRMMNIPLGDFNRGDVGQPSFTWRDQRLAPNICYEDLFGEELAVRFRDPAQAPTVFVNVSNIAWFGNTVAIDQHLQISRMRALEFARPMIRATNTGATVIIDRAGRVTHALPRHTRGVLTGEVEGGTGLTPFAAWASRLGLLPLWLLALAAVGAAAWRTRRSRAAAAGARPAAPG